MSNMVIDLLPILLLITVLIDIKPMSPLSTINDNYLTINTLKYYKGLFAIVIVFHHLSQRTQGGIVFRGFSYVGYLAVAAFFFYSGYGLQKSYMTKGEKYRKDFLKKRIPTILFPYIIVTFIYWLMNYVRGTCYSLKEICVAIFHGSPIVSNSWYIITILVFYFVYWILMTICKSNYRAMIIGGGIWYVLYTLCCIKFGYGLWWYNASHILIVGMLWALWEKKITKIIERYQIVIPIVWVAFIIVFVSKIVIASYLPINGIGLLIDLIITILFVISVVFFSMKVKIGNKALAFLGEISFEIYMIHGLFITIFRSDKIYIDNEFVWACLVLAFTIVSGYVLHIVFGKLLTKYKGIVGVKNN